MLSTALFTVEGHLIGLSGQELNRTFSGCGRAYPTLFVEVQMEMRGEQTAQGASGRKFEVVLPLTADRFDIKVPACL
jgi:hypothetical protein